MFATKKRGAAADAEETARLKARETALQAELAQREQENAALRQDLAQEIFQEKLAHIPAELGVL